MSTLRTLRIPVAIAASVVAVLSASASFAQQQPEQQPMQNDQATTPDTAAATTTATTTTPTPVQQPAPVIVQQQQPPPPVATTTTTQGAYVPAPATDRYTERTISHRPNRTLLSTGVGIFVLSYGTSVIAGAVSDRDEDKRLFIPVVGPWLDLGQRDCAARGCGGNEDLARAMIITSGVVQGAGVLMGIGSLIIPESTKVEERTTTAKAARRPVEKKPSVNVLPVAFGAGAGIGAVGRF